MDPRLYKAARWGDMELLTSIVEANDPTVTDLNLCLTPLGNTMLHVAVKFEQQEIVQKIVQPFPSLIFQTNSKGDTPLHVAARAGHLGLTKLLTSALNLVERNPVQQASGVVLGMRNLEGSNPIHEALKKSHEKVALHLLAFEERHHEIASEVNNAGESLLYLAAEAGLKRFVKKIINEGAYSTQGPDGQNPLHIAVIKGELEVVQILLEKASNLILEIDGFGNTVLHYASAQGYRRVYFMMSASPEYCQIRILKLLLQANPSLAYVLDKNGDCPLFIAARKGFYCAANIILDYCPDSIEMVNQKGQNALHVAVIEKNRSILSYQLTHRLEFKKLINEPDNDGNTPMHLAALTNDEGIVRLLIDVAGGTVDWTMSNKEGLTALDICGYTETEVNEENTADTFNKLLFNQKNHISEGICHDEDPIRYTLRECGAIPCRHRWQERFPPLIKRVKMSAEFKTLGLQSLPIVTSLVATVTFAAAFTVPGGYKNDGPREGLPVFMRSASLYAFVLSDILAFCSSMAATVLLFYANAHSEDAFKVYYALKTCYYISAVAILATITAFVTAVYVWTSKESLSLARTSLVLGSAVPLFLFCYRWGLKIRKWNLYLKDKFFLFAHQRDNV